MVKCDKSHFQGACCCNCQMQRKLMKHPANKDIGKGPISEEMGYVCITPFDDGSNLGKAIFFDGEHGMCEMHVPKKDIEHKFKVGDFVKLPFDETGVIKRIEERVWASKYYVKIRKATFNKTNEIVEFMIQHLEK